MKLSDEKIQMRESFLSQENLEELYLDRGWSAKQIADYFRSLGDSTLTAATVIGKLRILGIPTRSIAEATRQDEARRRAEETSLQKYGAINPLSRGTLAFQKKNTTVLKKYGVANVRQVPEFISKIKDTKRKNGTLGNCNPEAISAAFQRRLSDPEWSIQFSQTLSEKAKRRWENRSEEFKKESIKKLCEGHSVWWQNLDPERRHAFLSKAGFISKLETEFFNLIEEETGLQILRQVGIGDCRYSFDGQIEGTKILLEVNGTFFHADPRVYAETDELRFPDKQIRTAKYIWDKDFNKQQKALEQGYRIVIFWEKDIKETPEIELGRVWREYADYISQENK